MVTEVTLYTLSRSTLHQGSSCILVCVQDPEVYSESRLPSIAFLASAKQLYCDDCEAFPLRATFSL
uniref:Uncharacterized protein n=1 Tax=Anguilla anguilla TaxID=7936 RepID=A0A0E9XQ04_ANGAN